MPSPIKIANLEAFLASVREAQRTVGDLTIPLTEIGQDWMRTNQTIFTLSGPGPWKDLSGGRAGRNAKTGRYQSPNSGYKAQKLKKWGFIYPILKASGALERSITQPGDPNSLFEIINGETLILGTKVTSPGGVNYAAILNEARPFMNIPELSVARWLVILKTFIISRTTPGAAAAVAKGG